MPLKPLPRPLAEPGGALTHHLHDTGLELTSVTRRRPHQQRAAVICSVSQASCSDGHVRRHRGKSARFRGGSSHPRPTPLSAPLRAGLRFLPPPLPATPSAPPCGGPTPRGGGRAYHVPRMDPGWFRLCLFAGGSAATAGERGIPL